MELNWAESLLTCVLMLTQHVVLRGAYAHTQQPPNGTSALTSYPPERELCVNQTSTLPRPSAGLDALLYIVIVLMFYAVAMVMLMVKYVRREEEDAMLDFYYTEFVKREDFARTALMARDDRTSHNSKLLRTWQQRQQQQPCIKYETAV